MTTLYLAGPMSGYESHNFRAFFATAGALRLLGYDIENPAENDGATFPEAVTAAGDSRSWLDYMRLDIVRLSRCDGVVLLPGWRDSKGAQVEVSLARQLGLPLYVFQDYRVKPLYDIIGLSGYAQSGKDTTGKILIEDYGYTRISFADVLREALLALNPIVAVDDNGVPWKVAEIVADLDWDNAKCEYDEIRTLLQRLGTEVGRELISDTVWIDAAFRKMTQDGGKYVFTDVRFPNEADAIKGSGGALWRMERPGVAAVNSHVSDSALDDYCFDQVISNDGDLVDLRVEVAAIQESLVQD